MKTVYIMIGIQGSGKSTFCRRFLHDVQRINLDTLKTRNNEGRAIAACFENDLDFVVDNTNPTRENRSRYIVPAKAQGYRIVGYFMQSRLKQCIERNALREGKAKVPDRAIVMTSNKLEMPSYEEGFDEIYFVKNDGQDFCIETWREEE